MVGVCKHLITLNSSVHIKPPVLWPLEYFHKIIRKMVSLFSNISAYTDSQLKLMNNFVWQLV